MMGADHVTRITEKISGAAVTAVVDPDLTRATTAVENAPGAVALPRIEDALEQGLVDAVIIATPGRFHEPVLIPALDAGIPILCEKPLTPDSESSLRIAAREQELGRTLIQVGFMRRFDAEYIQLKELIRSGDAGHLLALHCAHRNPTTGAGYDDPMLITDSVAHEMDIVPWLAGEPVVAVEVRKGRRNSLAPSWLNDPQMVLLETESGVLVDVEINVNVQFGYQVTTQAVFERGIAEIGRTAGLGLWQDAHRAVAEHTSFKTRFAAAYDSEIQRWVTAARRGEIDGPSAWDGYRAATLCEAGVEAQTTGRRVEVQYAPTPPLYASSSH
jgi:myo-inositol 2-dehydrogenase/D-chiro-inositol 1-dehydrogenase